MRRFAIVAALLGVCLSMGCGTRGDLKEFLQKPRSPISGEEYRVYPPDVLSFKSRNVTEIGGVRQQVRPDGKVNLPLLGEIFVAGKTPGEIETAVNTVAKEFYEKVDSTVEVVGYNSQKIYVFGQVSGPGPRSWTGNDTLLDVLASAQPNTLAWESQITLVRGQDPTRGGFLRESDVPDYRPDPDSKTRIMKIDLDDMVQRGDFSMNVHLRPDDIVYVPPTPLAAVGLALQQLLFPVRPTMETVRLPATVGTGLGGGY